MADKRIEEMLRKRLGKLGIKLDNRKDQNTAQQEAAQDAPVTPVSNDEINRRMLEAMQRAGGTPDMPAEARTGAEAMAAQIEALKNSQAMNSPPGRIIIPAQPSAADLSDDRKVITSPIGREMWGKYEELRRQNPDEARRITQNLVNRQAMGSVKGFNIAAIAENMKAINDPSSLSDGVKVSIIKYFAKKEGREGEVDGIGSLPEFASPAPSPSSKNSSKGNPRTPLYNALSDEERLAVDWATKKEFDNVNTLSGGSNYKGNIGDVARFHGKTVEQMEVIIVAQHQEDRLSNQNTQLLYSSTKAAIDSLPVDNNAVQKWRESVVESYSRPEVIGGVVNGFKLEVANEQAVKKSRPAGYEVRKATFEKLKPAAIREEYLKDGKPRDVGHLKTLGSLTNEERAALSKIMVYDREGCSWPEGNYTADPNPTALCAPGGKKTANAK